MTGVVLEDERTALYRIYDSEDVLLYVGISNNFGRRWKEHAQVQPWWLRGRRQVIIWHDSRQDAEEAEKAAIKAEQPRFNVIHARDIRRARATDWLIRPGGLAERLHEMRRKAGLTSYQLAPILGCHRTRISKLENGQRMPTAEEIGGWATACSDPQSVPALLAMLREVHLQRDHGTTAQDLAEPPPHREVATTVIPSLLQTADYARCRATEGVRLFGTPADGIEAAVTARLRQQGILYDSRWRFAFLIHEIALHILPCPRHVMMGQLDRLLSLTWVANATIRIIPICAAAPVVPFTLSAGPMVRISLHTSDRIKSGTEATAYEAVFQRLAESAVTGEDARQLITQASERLRNAS